VRFLAFAMQRDAGLHGVPVAVVRWDRRQRNPLASTQETADMTVPRHSLEQDDASGLPDDLLESIEDTPTEDDDFGDETQRDEELAAEEGLEQDDFIDPRGEDAEDDSVV
jgi:hypothetical protein